MGFVEHLSGVKYMNLNRMYFKYLRTQKKIKVMRKRNKKAIQVFTFDMKHPSKGFSTNLKL